MAIAHKVQATIKPLTCPTYETNKDPKSNLTDQKKMGGLWFEYLYSDGYLGANTYECASWTILAPGALNDS